MALLSAKVQDVHRTSGKLMQVPQWPKKEKVSSRQQIPGRKCLIDGWSEGDI